MIYLTRLAICLLLGTSHTALSMELNRNFNTVQSPNARVKFELTHDDDGLKYSVRLDDIALIINAPLGLIIDNKPLGNSKLQLQSEHTELVKDEYKPVAGKAKIVKDHYRVLSLNFTSLDERKLSLNFHVRVYDEGVAFRYELPSQNGLNRFTIQNELTRFDFAADYQCFGLDLGKFVNSHEGEFDPIRASHIREHNLYDNPLVCKTGVKQTTFALAESDVRNYPGSWFSGRGDGGLGVSVNLTPRFDNRPDGLEAVAVRLKMPATGLKTPWRVIMLGDTPGDLTASSIIALLGEPSRVQDTRWIKPGKTAWDWWNDNQVVLDAASQKAGIQPGMNTATYKAYIDFAATLGLEYILIDAGWHEGTAWTNTPGSNVIKPIAAMDMPAILNYAKINNVGVWVWLQWQQLDWQMKEALSTYEKWGIKGIKVDFMNRSDQQMVDYYHKLLNMSAKYHIMVNMHGAYPPNGLARTYPHYLTQEGVMGAEYNKWSERVTATHNVTLPFTRMILGPIDYTPGGFRHTTAAEFNNLRRNTLPFVKTTRGQALAMYVVFDSPLQMLADSPISYSQSSGIWPQPKSEWEAGLEFIKDVPVTWDETKILQGDIGQFIVSARRKGEDWYLGLMTNESARSIAVPLSFLGEGQFNATIWQDGNRVSTLTVIKKQKLNAKSALNFKLAASGGAVAIIKRK